MANADLTRIAGNIGALNALNALENINKNLAIHQQRLASGKQINSAKDDPAGLTIATKMLARDEGLKTALNNIGDAQNMLSVAEGGMSKLSDILIQMRSKAEQAASDTLGSSERQAIQTQIQSYAAQIDNIVNETKWNGVKLLDGTVNKQFQTGADQGEFTQWIMSQALTATALGASADVDTSVSAMGGATNIGSANAAVAGPFSNLTSLATGSLQFVVLNSGNAGDTLGKLVSGATTNLTAVGGSTVATLSEAAPGAGELNNGANTITITGYDESTDTLSYSVNGVAAADVAGVTTAGTSYALGTTGLQVSFSDVTRDITLPQTIDVNYVKMGYAEVQLQNADGSAVLVDKDGTQDTGTPTDGTASSFYVAHGATYNTGRGINFAAGAMADLAAAQGGVMKDTFTFTLASANSVDVSTSAKASNYLGVVNQAIDTVTSQLSNLGSLMARLDFKSEQTSTAQINVEASYNRIMNANMAAEQVEASKYGILQQVATAMLAQANAAPQSLLSLFR